MIFEKSEQGSQHFLYTKFTTFRTIGFSLPSFSKVYSNFDLFFINTQAFVFLVVLIYILVIFSMMFGRQMAERRWSFSLSMLYFFPVFSILAPLWLIKAIYSTVTKRRPAWR